MQGIAVQKAGLRQLGTHVAEVTLILQKYF